MECCQKRKRTQTFGIHTESHLPNSWNVKLLILFCNFTRRTATPPANLKALLHINTQQHTNKTNDNISVRQFGHVAWHGTATISIHRIFIAFKERIVHTETDHEKEE